ncbi:MAG: hypothetical protein ACM3Q1_09530 [Bacteroidales bacterium]
MTGIVTGMRAEAALLRRCPLVACAGSEPETAARALLAAGATRLLSFGLAGGLDPALPPGTLVLASEIVTPDHRFVTDAAWAERFPCLLRAPLLGAGRPLCDRAAKAHAFALTGAVAVDMESGAVARVAAAAGVPMLAVRAVADPARQAVPPAALRCVDNQGRIRLRASLALLLRHPLAMPVLALQAQAGMAALRAFIRRADGL